MNTIVLKFGGSSVADNEKLNLVANKITTLYNQGYDIVVVVSAQGKKTDSLLSEAYELSKNPSNRELDVLLSTGEQASISKLSILLNELGYKCISLTGWQAGIYTNNVNQNAIIEHIDTERIKTELSKRKIVIIAGFQGINEKLDITTLGRGGSDTTAVCVAAALDATECYIYSDVEGVFTTDPKKVPEAKKLKEVSYDEMLDISNEGARVLHNRCVEIGKKFNIPIIAKSTFKKDNGTIVNNKIESQKIKSLVKNDEILSVHIIGEKIDFIHVYNLFVKNEIMPIEFINNANEIKALFKSSELNKINFIIQENLSDFEILIYNISRISIIGYGISNDTNILKQIISILESEKCDIQKIDINNGKIRITFKTTVSNTILETLHKELIKPE
ncbi:MAG: aspartate kinase [Clostridia bacterium]|nr:aspartate kinase [Clostridia bacterium]